MADAPGTLTPELAAAIQSGVHDRTCPRGAACLDRDACAPQWTRYTGGWPQAVAVLRARPRDAQGARRALHDATCSNGAACPNADDHARRTQGTPVVVLRKVLTR